MQMSASVRAQRFSFPKSHKGGCIACNLVFFSFACVYPHTALSSKHMHSMSHAPQKYEYTVDRVMQSSQTMRPKSHSSEPLLQVGCVALMTTTEMPMRYLTALAKCGHA